MRKTNLPYALLLVTTVCFSGLVLTAAQSARRPDSPDAVVRELYRVHGEGAGPVLSGESRRHVDKFFERRLAGLIWRELTGNSGDEVGNLDFDPLYNAQDIRISRLQVGRPAVEGDRATVPVSFRNYDQRTRIGFRMRRGPGGWKVENLVYGDGSDLVNILSDAR